jgi:hypothetical protein
MSQMSAQDHAAKAIELDIRADHYIYGDGADQATGQAMATRALTHATLALALFTRDAANGANHVHDYIGPPQEIVGADGQLLGQANDRTTEPGRPA